MNPIIKLHYLDSCMNLQTPDFFHCDRCSCIMLKERCAQRLKIASDRRRSQNCIESMDVHCIQCEQGKALTGLWVDAPHKLCMVDGCRRPVEAYGLCRLHYVRKVKNIKVKVCWKCKRELPLTSFYKCKSNHDGRQTMCIECAKAESQKQWERKVKIMKGDV